MCDVRMGKSRKYIKEMRVLVMAPMTVIKLNLHSVAGVDALVAASRFF